MIAFLRRIPQFFGEVVAELKKASWPWDPKEKGVKRYRELIDSTTVVVIAMVLISGYIAIWDTVMLVVIGWLVP